MADHLVERYRACCELGQPIQYEETLDLPTGVRIWQTNLAPVFDAEGRPVKLLGTSRDMTEYRTFQEELAQTSKLATLGTMAAGIAHEMSQPLNIIKITADDCGLMIEEGQTDVGYLSQGMELIATQAARMGEIVDQMRSFSRRDSRRSRPLRSRAAGPARDQPAGAPLRQRGHGPGERRYARRRAGGGPSGPPGTGRHQPAEQRAGRHRHAPGGRSGS